MNLNEFRNRKIEGRKILHRKILETFRALNPVAIHQFGSGVSGYRDEFSDMDIWVTFEDQDIDEVVRKRDEIYLKIAPVLIKNEKEENSPLGGKYSMVIFETDHGLYHVDIYLSKKSQTNIRPEAIFHYGSDDLPRGEWILGQQTKQEDPSVTLDFLVCMAFIGIKMVVRKNGEFLDFLFNIYQQERSTHFKDMKEIEKQYDFKMINNILDELVTVTNPQQKHAIAKIKNYTNQVTSFYG